MHNMNRDLLTLSDILSLALTSKDMWRRVRDTIKWEAVCKRRLYKIDVHPNNPVTRAELWYMFIRHARMMQCAVCWTRDDNSVPASWLRHYNVLHNRCFECFTRMHVTGRYDYVRHVTRVAGIPSLEPPSSYYWDTGFYYLPNEVDQYYAQCINYCVIKLGYDITSDATAIISNHVVALIFGDNITTKGQRRRRVTIEGLCETITWIAGLLYCRATQSTDTDQNKLGKGV
jgi:hypothetical protein